jgi:hypothetical protein
MLPPDARLADIDLPHVLVPGDGRWHLRTQKPPHGDGAELASPSFFFPDPLSSTNNVEPCHGRRRLRRTSRGYLSRHRAPLVKRNCFGILRAASTTSRDICT